MRFKLVLHPVGLALVIAVSAGPAMAGQHGAAHTNNPGGMNYYPDPWLSRNPDFGHVYDACQQAHRYYGEKIVLSGVRYTCP